MKRKPKSRVRPMFTLAFGFVLGIGAAYAGYRFQNSYVLVSTEDLGNFIQRYNALLMMCKQSLDQNVYR